jgi:hypothetical protein
MALVKGMFFSRHTVVLHCTVPYRRNTVKRLVNYRRIDFARRKLIKYLQRQYNVLEEVWDVRGTKL